MTVGASLALTWQICDFNILRLRRCRAQERVPVLRHEASHYSIMSYGEHDADYEERPGWEGDEDMMEEEYDDMGTGAGVEGDLEMGDDD